jgi:GntR family transcriptional regulator
MGDKNAMIHFRLDPRSGVPPYRQLIDQVRQMVSLGLLRAGDQLPSVREVMRQITINPNTVHRAYRDLEAEGLVEGRQGRGTFIVEVGTPPTTPKRQAELHEDLVVWIKKARLAGMDDETIMALVTLALQAKTVAKEKVTP